MSVHLGWWTVWGVNDAGKTVQRHIFAQGSFEAKHRFYAETGILADGAEEA
jgi:hypothetical protein